MFLVDCVFPPLQCVGPMPYINPVRRLSKVSSKPRLEFKTGTLRLTLAKRGAGMNEIDIQKLVIVLDAIRDNQTLQLDRQLEALTLLKEQLAMDQRQVERAERLQERAEQLQGKSAQLVAGARKLLVVMLPIVVVLIGYVSWLLLR